MNITIASKLMELYAACPKCGCEVIGNGKGLLECDTAAGFFKRSCGCGWHVEVTEVIAEGSMPEDPPELPTDTYICKECGHEMPLPKAYRAYTRCECGQKGAYLTNITDWAFDIPCVRCGSPNTVTYNPGRDCYGPVGNTQRRTKPRKKK